jgi:hypothetical protein
MPLKLIAGRLAHTALERVRESEANVLAVGQAPASFSVFDIERAFMTHYTVMDAIAARYNLDLRTPWEVDCDTGDIVIAES